MDHIIATATVDVLLAPKLRTGSLISSSLTLVSISTDKDGASDRTKIAILQVVGSQDMVDLVEMVEKVQLDAVVSDLGNWTVTVNAKTRAQAIDNISSQEN